MQQLTQDMRDMEMLLVPLCEKMMTWTATQVYEDFQEITQPMTTLVSLLLNNKQGLAECGVDVEELSIIGILERIVQAMERRDEILLLDSIYHGYLPWVVKVRRQIEQYLRRQEVQS